MAKIPGVVEFHRPDAAAAALTPQSRFRFGCHAGLACFNECCNNPTVILKPYDIIGLRRFLGLTATDFLDRYTLTVVDEASHLPLVLLETGRGEGRGCPFLGDAGCTVYSQRPGACRLFPVTQGSRLVGQEVVHAYFLKTLDFCRGFEAGEDWTLARWQADQEMAPHDFLSREWLEIILRRAARPHPAEDPRAVALFAMAAYDMDKFRDFVLKTSFVQVFEIPAEVAAVLAHHDVALLRLGYKYLKMVLGLEDPQQMQAEMRRLPGPEELSIPA